MRVLVTSVGTATGVNLIKALKKIKGFVVGVDINDYGYTAGSQLVDAYYKVPYAQEALYLDVLNSIVERECIDILIPINDIEVIVISEHRDIFNCKCLLPEVDVLCDIADKFLCTRKIEEFGVRIPHILDNDNIQIERILRERVGIGSKGILYLNSGVKCPPYSKEKSFLQERVIGNEYTVDVLSDADGVPLYIIPRRRIEVKSGVATKVLVEEKKELIESVFNIYSYIKIPGLSNVQFICDMNGRNYFIEINPRFSGCGAATLATCPTFISDYIKIVNGERVNQGINRNVMWNSIVTRYYEEIVYHA